MDKIMNCWLKGCKVFLRFLLFCVVLYILSYLFSILFIIIPVPPNSYLQERGNFLLEGVFLLLMTIFVPFIFYFASEGTGLLLDKPKPTHLSSSEENKKASLVEQLKEKINKTVSRDK